MKQLKIYFLFVLLAGLSTNIYAGGWPQLKHHGYFKVSQWWVVSDQHYTDTGQLDPNVTSGLFNTSLYAEYGFTDRFTGILYLPFFSRAYFNNTVSFTTGEILNPGEAINSIGDTDIGLKYGIIPKGPWVLSATLTFGLPLGNERGGSEGVLQTGDGEFNQMLQLDLGTSFQVAKLNAYANVYTAFNNRTNGFSDEFRYGLEAGVSFLNNKLTTTARLYGVESLNNGDPNEIGNSTSVFGNNSEHTSAGLEIAYSIKENWGVAVSGAAAFRGRIIFAAPAYSVGVFMKI